MSGRVGTPKKNILMVGSGRVGSVIWSVGRSEFFSVNFGENNDQNCIKHKRKLLFSRKFFEE